MCHQPPLPSPPLPPLQGPVACTLVTDTHRGGGWGGFSLLAVHTLKPLLPALSAILQVSRGKPVLKAVEEARIAWCGCCHLESDDWGLPMALQAGKHALSLHTLKGEQSTKHITFIHLYRLQAISCWSNLTNLAQIRRRYGTLRALLDIGGTLGRGLPRANMHL